MMIEVRGLSFAYDGGPPMLRGIDLAIERGTINVVIGPSGCGKTTLLRCLTGIIPSIIKGELRGTIKLGGREIIAANEANATSEANEVCAASTATKPNEISLACGLVMQEPDHQIVMTTVEDDIAFGPENRRKPPNEIRAAVDSCARSVGLHEKKLENLHALSGGEKQRLAIAGTMASLPSILLFDEPMSGLDAEGRAAFTGLIRDMRAEGRTMLIVEHDFGELAIADTWILMKGGRILSVTPPSAAPRDLLEDGLWL
ncbi:MAG: energy-coupling factor ABC transporter ATP-binding protein [Clostridiales Family XIII bacterium]|jgi:energy-coupling factor transport system ATP-binding protein|nr:energy-coupling factor ABC transporter ATP-binding protein [Clostridiales Family XIII bacterium]